MTTLHETAYPSLKPDPTPRELAELYTPTEDEKLLAAGYPHAANLYGGIFEWVNRKQPLVNQEGHPTEYVHAYSKMWGTWLQVKKKRKVYK